MTRSTYLRTGGALIALCIVSACGSKAQAPAGQVAATVDGEEVTLQEVNTEVQAGNFPATIDKKLAQQVALQRVIDRKMVIKAAAEKGLDKTPEYLSQKRRDDELLLAQVYARQQLAAVPVPTDSDITKFMSEHSNAFGKREQLTFDQIRFPMPQNPAPLQALQAAHSMAEVAAVLTKLGIKFERSPAAIDSAALPTPLMTQLNNLPASEPFALPSQGLMTINLVTSRKPVANDDKQARAAAVSAWRQEKFTTLLSGQVTALKGKTKVEYQNGFSPPPANNPAAPKPAAAAAAAPKG